MSYMGADLCHDDSIGYAVLYLIEARSTEKSFFSSRSFAKRSERLTHDARDHHKFKKPIDWRDKPIDDGKKGSRASVKEVS
jgi:hypothetical protein